MNQIDIVNFLDSVDTRHEGLNTARNLIDADDEVINKLIECAIKENDPNFNGEYINVCVKHRSIYEISSILLDKVIKGSEVEKMGALKALYHVREERLIINFEDGTFYESSKYKDNKVEYKKRLDILKKEYIRCDNLVIKFFYQWAIPSEKDGLLKGQAETDIDLLKMIKGNEELVALWDKYRKWV